MTMRLPALAMLEGSLLPPMAALAMLKEYLEQSRGSVRE